VSRRTAARQFEHAAAHTFQNRQDSSDYDADEESEQDADDNVDSARVVERKHQVLGHRVLRLKEHELNEVAALALATVVAQFEEIGVAIAVQNAQIFNCVDNADRGLLQVLENSGRLGHRGA
jgi:hypothetical protein